MSERRFNMKKLILGLLVALMACNPPTPASTIDSLTLSASPTLSSGSSTWLVRVRSTPP
jgi:hypothetical protein